MKFVPYSRQHITKDDIEAVVKSLKSDLITTGPKINEFEKKLAKYTDAKYCVVLNSGTSALHASYFALGLTENDEFITSPITFSATTNAGLYLGARPVFVDVERDTGNIDVLKIEERISKNTKLIVPVHYSGHPVDLAKINKIANKHKLFVIEDACHALGSKYKSSITGNCKYSDMVVFSFHPVKHITTGEGGVVLTNKKNYYEKLLMFRNHGITKEKKFLLKKNQGGWYQEMHHLGFNYRLTDFQAALGISQLGKLIQFVAKRRQIAYEYHKRLNNNPYFDLPIEKNYAKHSYHLYPIKLKSKYIHKKKEIFTKLIQNGIGAQVHYIPVYMHPYYQKLGYRENLCPVSNDFYEKVISIPMFPLMTKGDIDYVVKVLFEVFKNT